MHNSLLKITMDGHRSMPLMENYASEEKDFATAVVDYLEKRYASERIRNVALLTSVGGKNRPRIDMLGTNFCPDIEVSVRGRVLLAIELKIGRSGIASSISQTLAQMLIYKLKYKEVIGFVVHSANDYPKFHEYDSKFYELCQQLHLNLIVRRLGTS